MTGAGKTHAELNAECQPLMDAWLAEHDPEGRGPGEGLTWSGEFRWTDGKPVMVGVRSAPHMTHREALVTGLIGERGRLYDTSASFHYAINMLAEMLPLMVNGLAAQAEAEKVTYENAKRGFGGLLRARPVTPEEALRVFTAAGVRSDAEIRGSVEASAPQRPMTSDEAWAAGFDPHDCRQIMLPVANSYGLPFGVYYLP